MTFFTKKIFSGFPDASFVTRLIAGSVSIIVFVAALTGLSLHQSRRQYEDQAMVSTQNLAQVLEQNIDDIMGKTDLVLLAVADEFKRQAGGGGINGPALNGFISRQKDRIDVIDALMVTDAQGTVRYGDDAESEAGTTVANQDYYIMQRDNPDTGLFISKPSLERGGTKKAVVLSLRLNRPDGSFAGIVYATIKPDTFHAIFSKLNIGSKGVLALRDRDLSIIARFPAPQGGGSTLGSKSASPQLLEMLKAGRTSGTWHAYSAIDKVERVFSFHRLSHYPLYVVVGRATTDYLAGWRREALKMILLLALFSLAILISSRQMLLRKKREQQALEELKRLNASLEDRIAARTAEVSRFNEQLQAELTERKRSEAALMVREKQLAESQRIAHVGSWEHNLKTNRVFWSDELFRILGLDPKKDPADFGMFFNLVHPEDQSALKKGIEDAIRLHSPFSVYYRITLKSGETRIIHAQAELIADDEGEMVVLSGTGRDVTAQKKAEERLLHALSEKETLLRELYHRTKNNMHVIMSLISLQISTVTDKQNVGFLSDTQNRIMSMALVHEKLYGSRDLSNVNLKSYIEDFAEVLLRSYHVDANRIALLTEIDDMVLSIDTIMPIGLIMNELISNTLKYAFPGERNGRIRISAGRTADAEIRISYSDDGIGFPPGFDFRKTSTLGLQLVHNLVESQLQGRLSETADQGAGFVILFREPDARKGI